MRQRGLPAERFSRRERGVRTLATSLVGQSKRLFGAAPAALASLVMLSALCLGPTACETASTSDETSITGVVVRTTQLLEGTGCGTRVGQVYKYLAVAVHAGQTEAVAAGVYDCFADAAFVNLPADPKTGGYDFEIFVYAFDASRYEAQKAKIDEVLGDMYPPPGRTPSAPVLQSANALEPYAKSRCTVTQALTVQSVAACTALR